MKKWYAVYFVASLICCVAALLGINRIVENTNRQVAALHAHEQAAPAPTAEQVAAQAAAREAAREAAEVRSAAVKASAEQAARIKKALEAVAIVPKPAPKTEPAHFYTPKAATPAGRVYSNRNLKPAPVARRAVPDRSPARVIVDFSPSDANRLEWQEAVRSGRCAAFSFVDVSGKRIDRLFCDPVVVR
jgi:hypothetical protein